MAENVETTRIPCAECQAERDETGLDGIWCSSPECGEYVKNEVIPAVVTDEMIERGATELLKADSAQGSRRLDPEQRERWARMRAEWVLRAALEGTDA